VFSAEHVLLVEKKAEYVLYQHARDRREDFAHCLAPGPPAREREQYLKSKLGACGPSSAQRNAQGEGEREEFIDNQHVTTWGGSG